MTFFFFSQNALFDYEGKCILHFQMIALDLYALERYADEEVSAGNNGRINGSVMSASPSAAICDHLAATFLAAVLPTYTLKPSNNPKDYFALPVVYVLLVCSTPRNGGRRARRPMLQQSPKITKTGSRVVRKTRRGIVSSEDDENEGNGKPAADEEVTTDEEATLRLRSRKGGRRASGVENVSFPYLS